MEIVDLSDQWSKLEEEAKKDANVRVDRESSLNSWVEGEDTDVQCAAAKKPTREVEGVVDKRKRKSAGKDEKCAKRSKVEEDRKWVVSSHPLGIQSLGMSLHEGNKRNVGNFRVLNDLTIVRIIGHLDAKDMLKIGLVSKAMLAFSFHDDLWRVLVLRRFGGNFIWNKSWRGTYIATRKKSKEEFPLRINTGLCSDVLFHSWMCKTTEIPEQWLSKENISVCSYDKVSVKEFVTRFERPNIPALIRGCANKWKCFGKWNPQFFEKEYSKTHFHVGGYSMRMDRYIRYMRECCDDQTLYLFDKKFHEAAPILGKEYVVPKYFSSKRDLFSLLDNRRPDYKWLIMGPKRSGSTFHKDPNGTSAWNACIHGLKKWILIPPNTLPCGVHASVDGVDVTSPVSLVEWFINFYHQLDDLGVNVIECIQHPGDIIFVPCGWWHCVLNVKESIAITQNYVSTSNLSKSLNALRLPELVSGVPKERRSSFREEFLTAIKTKAPESYEEYLSMSKKKKFCKNSNLAKLFQSDEGTKLDQENELDGEDIEEATFKFSF